MENLIPHFRFWFLIPCFQNFVFEIHFLIFVFYELWKYWYTYIDVFDSRFHS
nr:MAG TPA: hypothetical protein [Caudoviricetes sp.]DAU81102.1 MAG TPA: hypothetical protein [Caudoviricetes sp.]